MSSRPMLLKKATRLFLQELPCKRFDGSRLMCLSAAHPSGHHTKTAIQEVGWEYLLQQEKSKRPLSPHLSIYKPQITWMLSGFHRITACVMSGALVVGSVGFAVLPIDFTTFINTVDGWQLPWVVTDSVKFIIAFPIIFHTLNSIRFLGYDMAMGTDLPTIYRTGWMVLGLSTLLSILVILHAKHNKGKKIAGKNAAV